MCAKLENPFIGCYWGPRKISEQGCAEKVSATLLALAKWPPFGQWYFCMNEATDPIIPVSVEAEDIFRVLREDRTDFKGNVVGDRELYFSAWSGSLDDAYRISFRCGAQYEELLNCLTLRLPPRCPPLNASEGEDLREILGIFIEIWDPEHAVVTSRQYMNRNRARTPYSDGGWFIYHKGHGVQCMLPVLNSGDT